MKSYFTSYNVVVYTYYLWEPDRENSCFFWQGWWFSTGGTCAGKQADVNSYEHKWYKVPGQIVCVKLSGFFLNIFYFMDGKILSSV